MANAINSLNFNDNIYTFTLPYGTCSTAADTAAKTVDVDNFSLEKGARVLVKFTVTNNASSPTLNVEGTGAKAIYYRGSAINAGVLAANRTYEFVYNGTQWDLIGDLDTNTTYGAAGTSLGFVKSGGDVTISDGVITVNDDSHNHIISNVDGLQDALAGKFPLNGASGGSNLNTLYTAGIYYFGTSTTNTPCSYGHVIVTVSNGNTHNNSTNWISQLAFDTGNQMWFREKINGNNWNAWRRVIDSENIKSQSVKYATSAGSATTAINVSAQAGTTNANRHIWFSDSATETKRAYDDDFKYNPSTNVLTVGSITGNAATATKLATARTISLDGNMSGSIDFDGSGNKSFSAKIGKEWTAITTVGAYSRLCLLSGYSNWILSIQLSQSSQVSYHTYLIGIGYECGSISQIGNTGYTTRSNQVIRLGRNNATSAFVEIFNNYGYNSAKTVNCTCKLIPLSKSAALNEQTYYTAYTAGASTSTVWAEITSQGKGIVSSTFYGNLSGNATSATKLATARTISLTGDVTGSTTFDGSGNVSIAATVADDSHNHIISNVDGLQTALDGKVGQSISTSADLNTITTSGFYRVSNTNANMPSGGSYGQLIVSRGADTITQIIGAYGSGKLYTRSGNPSSIGGNGGWTDWKEIIDSSTISSQSVNYATSAGRATKATQDGSGNTITSTYLKLSGGTLSGKLTASGKISVPTSGSAWISGMTTGNASIAISTQNTSGSYHPIIAGKTYNGHIWNLGTSVDNIGFYGFKSGRTENATDWSFAINVSSGAINASGSITAASFHGSGSGLTSLNASNISSGTLAVARGGTGTTSNPSMLINLGSTSAANVFATSPRPGITGTLGLANGGTGKTTAKDAANAFINALDTGSSAPVDADYYICQYAGGGTSTTTYHRRPTSALWTYMKGKIDTTYYKTVTKSGAIGSVTLADKTDYIYTGVTSLTLVYPSGNFECWLSVTTSTSAITLSFPSGTKFIGASIASLAANTSYEISIKDKVAIIKKVG